MLHSDLNSFYASVECLYNPSIRDKPVAVCGQVELRHGIVLAANPLAKKYGIRTGDTVGDAQKKCRNLICVEPHMDRYNRFSKMARQIYCDFSPLVEPYGLDECWIDMTGAEHLFGDGPHIAQAISGRIKKELGVTVSIGVSFNKTISKLGSDYKKPDGITIITEENFKDVVWPLPASDLLFVGPARTRDLARYGIVTIGQLANAPDDLLKRLFGVVGLQLKQTANGYDNEPVSPAGYRRPDKSIGNSRTTPKDMVSREDIRLNAMLLAESVAERMRNKNYRCNSVQVTLRYANLAWFQRQAPLDWPICTAQGIGNAATELILRNWTGEPLRSIGVRAQNLIIDEFPQLSLLPEVQAEHRQEGLERAMQDIRRRFGHFSIQRGMMLADREFSDLDIRHEDSAHSLAFFHG